MTRTAFASVFPDADAPQSLQRGSLRLAEILGALSHALDLTEGQPKGHCKRACWIGVQIGTEIGLCAAGLSNVFFTTLLKDLGCSSNAARICELYLTDDIGFKQDFKTLDGSLSAALRFVFTKTGLEVGLAERIRAIVNILRNGGELVDELIETRCNRGADIAARLRFNTAVQTGIRHLDEHFDGSGRPQALHAQEIPLESRIALVAQVTDIFRTEGGPRAAVAEVKRRSGGWFDPLVVQALEKVSAQPGFWEVLDSPDIDSHLFSMTPAIQSVLVDEEYLDQIAQAFCDVVDAKSPFTAGHSERVTLYTDMIAEAVGMEPQKRRHLRRAALLHDIGKLAVSNQILDKPGRLSQQEWDAVKSHPLHSQAILQHVHAFADLAPIAGAHHERLDGKGYPFGLVGDEIPVEARMLTVADVFDALTADRPYRNAMPVAAALAIIRNDVGTAFDIRYVDALEQGLDALG